MPSVTMQDIADAAGVHRTTVSLAMRHHPSIPPETRKRLLSLASEMGYRPNPMVSALMTELRGKRSRKQHEVIAYVTAYPGHNPWRRYASLVEMFAGAQAKASALGFEIQEFDVESPDMNGARLKKILRTRGIRGVLLAPLPTPQPVSPLDLSSFAAVSLGIGLQALPLEHIASDHYQCMQLAIHECRKLGYARIGFAIGKRISARLEGRWLAAYLYEHATLRKRAVRPLFLNDAPGWWEHPCVEQWCARERPEVIISPLGEADWRAFSALTGRPAVVNLTLPADTKGCAGILQDTFKLGEIGVERVVSRLLHNDVGLLARTQNNMLHGEWSPGASLPPRT